MKPLRISFDFDCTFGETIIQRKASLLINSSEYSDIFIITARNKGESYNRDLLSVAKRLGIPDSNIHYTEECELISLNTNCIPLLIWDEWCKDSIKNGSFGKGIY